MNLKLVRNAFFFAQGALFIVLLLSMEVLYLPGPVQLLLGIAFVIAGVVVVVLTARLDEAGIRKSFFILAGASAAAIPLFAILHNFMFEAFFFVLALFVFPALFVVGWLGSVALMGVKEGPISKGRKLMVGLVIPVVVAVAVATVMTRGESEGYSVTSELVKAPDEAIVRVFVAAEVDQALMPVFWHSFEHSLVSAFESNGIDATIELIREADAVEYPSTDAIMKVDIDPLYRTHRDGHEAIVGTVFEVTLSEAQTGDRAWYLSGKVDYIVDAFFNSPDYAAYPGIRKEFAWQTTAAIVRTLMIDVQGEKSGRIYTDTESRQRHGQRTD